MAGVPLGARVDHGLARPYSDREWRRDRAGGGGLEAPGREQRDRQGLAVRAARGEGACDGGSLGVEVGAGTEHRGWTTMRVVVDDPFDARLLDRLQTDLPLVPRPWAALADALDSDEADGARARARAPRGQGRPPGVRDLRHAAPRLQGDARRRAHPARAAGHGRRRVLRAPRGDAQLRARARLQPLVHLDGCGRTRRSGSSGRSRCSASSPASSRSGPCPRCASSRSASTST